jgi:intracellular septation protein
MSAAAPAPRPLSPGLKIAVELGPLLVFFLANARFGIFAGTAVYMAAAAVALAVNWALTRRIAVMPIVALAFVVAFGALTLLLHDDVFIKVKVTVVNALFAVLLVGGLLAGKPLLRIVLGEAIDLDDEGWRILSWRWACFFFAVAALNEIVWRTMSTDAWVNFKVFALLPLTFVFALSQGPLMQRHMRGDGEGGS